MKLSEYINSLQEFLNDNGDLDCFYACDDEGNGYQQVNYAGNLYYTMEPEAYRPEMYSDEDKEEYPDDEFTAVCVVN
jgi:hypothetical protein